MSNVRDLGGKPRLSVTFKVNDIETAPTAALLIVRYPDGNQESYFSPGFSNQGSWDAATNSPTLVNGTGTAGHYYTVTVAGTIDFGDGDQAFAVGDRVFYDGDSWLLAPSPQAAALTPGGTGVFYYDLPLHQVGAYIYRFEGIGTVHAADEVYFTVKRSAIR